MSITSESSEGLLNESARLPAPLVEYESGARTYQDGHDQGNQVSRDSQANDAGHMAAYPTHSVDAAWAVAPVGVAIFDRELRYVRINGALARMNDLPVEAHLGHTVSEALGEGSGRAIEPHLRHALQTGQPSDDLELSSPGAHFLASFYPIPAPDGSVAGVAVTVFDVSARKRVEQSLAEMRQRERRFRERLAALPDISLDLAHALTIDELCRRAVERGRRDLGFDRVGIFLLEALPNIVRGTFGTDDQGNTRDERSWYGPARASGLNRILLGGERFVCEPQAARITDRDGRTCPHAFSALWDGERIIGVLSTDNLITLQPVDEAWCELVRLYGTIIGSHISHHRQLTALRASEERLRLAQESGRMGAWDWDLTTGIEVWSPEMSVLFGVSHQAEHHVDDFFAQVHPDDRERIVQKAQRSQDTLQDYVDDEFRIIRPDGRVIWLADRARIHRDEGGHPVRMTGVNMDITERLSAEEARSRLAAIVESSEDAIYSYDLTGRILTWNASAEKLFGWRADEIVGRPIGTVLPPELADEPARLMIPAIKAGGSIINLETMRQRRDGSRFNALLTASPIKDAAGQPVALSIIVRDVTGRKLAEAALHESEARYRQLVELMPDCVYIQCEGRIRFINRAGAALLGYDDPAELEGVDLVERIIHPDGHAIYRERRAKLEAGEAVPYAQSHWIRRDGSELWVEVSASPMTYQGQSAGLTIARDIGERKRAEETSALLAAIVTSSSDAIVSKTLEGIITSWNQGAQRMFGYTASEMIGQSILRIIPPDRRTDEDYILAQLRAGQRIENFETERVTKDGRRVTVSLTLSPVRDSAGNIIGASKIIRDITERARRERNLAVLARISDDLARYATVDEITRTVGEHLAEHLGLAHCLFVRVHAASDDVDKVTVLHDQHAPGALDLTGVYDLARFHTQNERQQLARGQTVAIDNVRGGRPSEAAENVEAHGIRALLTVPYLTSGRWAFALSVQHNEPHAWQDDERDLLHDVAARMYPRLERAWAEQAVRDSQTRYRNLLSSIDQGFCVLEILFDDTGRATDYRFLEVNPTFERHTGLKDAIGKTARELVPNLEDHWVEIYARVAETGAAERFEQGSLAMGRLFEVEAARVGGAGSRQVGLLFRDITARTLAEHDARFLANVGDLIRQASDGDDLLNASCQLIAEHLGVPQCVFSNVDVAAGTAVNTHEHRADGVTSLLGTFQLIHYPERFVERLMSGRSIAIEDIQSDLHTTVSDATRYRALDTGAVLSAPLMQRGTWVGSLFVTQNGERHWTEREVRLLETVAERVWLALERLRSEAALHDSNTRFRIAEDASNSFVYDFDLATGDEQRTENFTHVLGYSVGEVKGGGSAWEALIHPDDVQHVHAETERAVKGDWPGARYEYRIRHKDGRWLWVLDENTVVRDANGTPRRIIGSVIDITPRKIVEERLARLQAVTARFAEAQTLDDVRQVVLSDVVAALGAAAGALRRVIERTLVIDQHQLGLTIREEYVRENSRLPLEAAHPSSEAARTGEPVFINSVEDIGQRYPQLLQTARAQQLEAAAHLPLKRGNEVFAVLALAFAHRRVWDEAERAFALALANRAAVAYERARLFEAERAAKQAAEHATRRVESLQTVTANLSKALTPSDIVHVILSDGLSALGADGSVFALLTDDGNEFMIVNTQGYPAGMTDGWQRFPANTRTPMGDVVRTGQPLFFASRDEAMAVYPKIFADNKSGHQAWAFAPLMNHDHALGAVSVSFAKPHTFGLNERNLLVALMQQCAQALERAQLYERLSQNEERFRMLADNMSQLAWTADATGNIFWYNQRWYDYTGTTLEEVQGWGWRQVHHPDHVERVVNRIQHAWDTGTIWEDTFPLRGKDGQYRWFLSRAVPIRDAGGRIVRWFGTNTDVTEQLEVEAALAASEARWRNLADAMPQIVWTNDAHGQVTYLNRRWLNYTGMSLEDSLRDPNAAVHPDDRPVVEAAWAGDLVQGQPFEYELRLRERDGQYRWFLSRCVPICDDDGHITLWHGTSTDIHERKQTELDAQFLVDMGDRVNSAGDPRALMGQIAQVTARHFGVARAGFDEVDLAPGRSTRQQGYAAELTGMSGTYPLGAFSAALSAQMRAGGTVVVNDTQRDTRTATDYLAAYGPAELRAMLSVPLLRGGEWVASFWLATPEPRIWEAREIALFRSVAERAWLAAESARVQAQTAALNATLETRVAERTAELYQSREELRQLSTYAERMREDERTRIAREVHDQLGGAVTVLKMGLARVRKGREDDAELAAKVQTVRDQADELVQAIRRVASDLRPPMLDDFGLGAALAWQAREWETRTGIVCQVDMPGEEVKLDRDRRTAVFRVFQESLTNIARHAQATIVTTTLAVDRDHAVLTVCDDGVGISAESLRPGKSLGLLGMRERIREVAGELVISGSPGAGTTVTIRVPLS